MYNSDRLRKVSYCRETLCPNYLVKNAYTLTCGGPVRCRHVLLVLIVLNAILYQRAQSLFQV